MEKQIDSSQVQGMTGFDDFGPPDSAVVEFGVNGDDALGQPPVASSMGPVTDMSSSAAGPSSGLGGLDELQGQRADVQRQLSALGAARERLGQAALHVQQLEAEQHLLDSDHSSALGAWVKAGCEGPQPAPDDAFWPPRALLGQLRRRLPSWTRRRRR